MRRAAPIAGVLLTGCLSAPSSSTDASPGADGPARAWVRGAAASAPGRLYGPKLTYDPDRRVVLMFGGRRTFDIGSVVSELWAWDGEAWSALCDVECPPQPRIGHGFAYDVDRKRAVLVGGLDAAGELIDDVWEWDGVNWIVVDADGAAATPRARMWMTYHPARKRVVMFGGSIGLDTPTDDLFEWDGATWTQQPHATDWPVARSDDGAAMAYDPSGERVLVYGGAEPPRDDLWAWDGEGWKRLCDGCTGRARGSAAVAVDPSRDQIVIVNGYDGLEIAGTVELDRAGQVGCRRTDPTARDTGSIAYDPLRDALVYYGGNGPGCDTNNCDETLELVTSQDSCE